MEGTDFKDFKKELLSNKNIRSEYNALEPKYMIIRAIIARRNQLSMSQRQLAHLTGMQQPAICRLERGDNNITVGTFFKVADALNLDVSLKARRKTERSDKVRS